MTNEFCGSATDRKQGRKKLSQFVGLLMPTNPSLFIKVVKKKYQSQAQAHGSFTLFKPLKTYQL